MPIYEYECPEKHRHEVIRSYALRDTPWGCITCGGAMTRIEISAAHVPPDGVYSYAPNLGSAEQFEKRLIAQREGKRVIPKVG